MLQRLSIFSLTSLLILCLGLAGCQFPPRIYRLDVQQGNRISPEMLAQLKIGMDENTVLTLMGPPTLEHVLSPNRWEYYYYFKPGSSKPISEKHLTLYFNAQHKLEQIIKDL
jgi:outer membrane protein assembly factor BamE